MKIHKEGTSIIVINAAFWILLSLLFYIFNGGFDNIVNHIIAAISLFMTLFVLTFFRVPQREAITGDSLIVSPGDGKVVNIKRTQENEFFKGEAIQISIFLTFFNVHVTWFPIAGIVKYFKYHPGKYIVAFHPKASEKNERTTIGMETKSGKRIMFRQIAGIVARRVVCYAKEGEFFEQNQEAGFIKFGSRLDVFLPVDSEIICKIGDQVRGHISPLARLSDSE